MEEMICENLKIEEITIGIDWFRLIIIKIF